LCDDIERLKEVHATRAELQTVKNSLESKIGEVRRGWEAGLTQLKAREVQEVKVEVTALQVSLRSIFEKERRDSCSWKGNRTPSLEGIISYLTKKHGGNVHEKRIVTITSKSVIDNPYPPTNVADLTSDRWFNAKNEPGQWVCWDFREMRVRPTHYTIRAALVKSWVVEGSLDGASWTEIDRQRNNQDFKGWRAAMASFAVSKPAECRFIRLTQTDKNHDRNDYLVLRGVEFFGRLSE
jgi:hypothetical protein